MSDTGSNEIKDSRVTTRSFLIAYGFLTASFAAGVLIVVWGVTTGDIFLEIMGALLAIIILACTINGLVMRVKYGHWGGVTASDRRRRKLEHGH